MGPLLKMQKILSSKINALWLYMKFYGFHGNPLCDFKEWGHIYKTNHISTEIHPR